MMRRVALIFLPILCVVHGRALSQQPTAFLQGIVVEEGGGTPIAKASVELRAAAGSSQAIANTQTDRDGKFYLPNVTPGAYRVVVTHAGHVNAEYGQRYPGGTPSMLVLAPGQRAMDLRIAMTRAGVISGHITDKGQPIGQADAFAMRAVYTEGQLSLTPVLSIRTDDLGEYHLFWLPPGRYYIVAAVWDFAGSVPRYVNAEGTNTNSFIDQRYIGRAVFLRATAGGVLADNEAHIPIFYPGTPDPKLATVIDVKPGGDLRGVDIDASAVITPRVRGRVVGLPAPVAGPTGQPVRVSINMRPISPTVTTSSAQNPGVSADSNGNFEITNAAPGRYMLTAAADNLSGRVLVEVRDRDVDSVVVPLQAGFNLSGRLAIERATPVRPDTALTSLRVALRSDPLLPGAATYAAAVQADGSFAIPSGILPGDYRVLVNPILVSATPPDSTPAAVPAALANQYVKSIRMGDADILNDRLHLESQPQETLAIVIGSNPGSISGRVLDESQRPAPGAAIVLVHDNGLRYRVNEKTSSSDSSGRFEFTNVPPGNYKLFAFESIERGAWQDPERMRAFESRGVTSRLVEGGKISIDVPLIGE
jgi:5-hydroxyisourate hydrolase-like protein (transthyretin family)